MYEPHAAFFVKIDPRSPSTQFWDQKTSENPPKMVQNGARCLFFGGCFFVLFWDAFLERFWTILGSKMEPRSPPDLTFFAPLFGSDPSMGPRGPSDPILEAFWSHFGSFWEVFGPILDPRTPFSIFFRGFFFFQFFGPPNLLPHRVGYYFGTLN